MAETFRSGNRVMLFGNGGSAADAQHIAAELVGRFSGDRAPLPALALTVDTSALTAIANDFGYERVFERQVRAHARAGDIAIGITTSGRSLNVLRAIDAARDLKAHTIMLIGAPSAELRDRCDICIAVPTRNVPRIQECHITIGHTICELVEADLFGPSRLLQAPRTDLPFHSSPKIVPIGDLAQLRRIWRAQRQIVVWTNGCFDLLHAGHLVSLEAAKALGDILIVGLNADATIRNLKGEERPVYPLAQRAALIAALEPVDFVVPFDEPTPEKALAYLQPDIHCKGADYAPPAGAPIPEAALVEGYGGRIVFLPLVPDLSSTRVLQRIRSQ